MISAPAYKGINGVINGMIGGARFSEYDNYEKITEAFKISDTSCEMLNRRYKDASKDASKDVDGNPLKFLFLVKVSVSATSYSYKLVYTNTMYVISQNYLYSYDDIHINIPYIDFYIEYSFVW